MDPNARIMNMTKAWKGVKVDFVSFEKAKPLESLLKQSVIKDSVKIKAWQ